MLVDIQTVDLHLCGNAQADELIDELEDNEHHNDNVDVNGNEAQQLGAQLCQTAAVEETCVLGVGAGGEQAHRNGAPDAVGKVDRNRTYGVIHLGDILNGSIPENASRFVLSQELARFQNATASGKLYIACGDDDGFRNERYVGQIVTGIVTDERWYEETAYLESYVNLHRPRNKPYYFVDFYDRKMRLIFLSSHLPQIDEQEELFEKSCQYGVEQLAWLKTEALQLPEGWVIFLFSHALPKSRFETGTDPWNYMEYASEPAMMLLRQAQKHGIRIGGWFAGHYACDYETTFCHIPYFLIDSVRPQPIKSLFPNVRKCTERGLGAETEDLWDVLLLKPNQRRIYLLRFGAGEDRVFDY